MVAQNSGSAPILTFNSSMPPFGILAAAKLGGVELDLKPEDKTSRDAPITLTFPSGYVSLSFLTKLTTNLSFNRSLWQNLNSSKNQASVQL